MKPLLSILIPSVPSRILKLNALLRHFGDVEGVEILALVDNKARTIGAKRQSLLDIARGHYVAFCDDDDWTSSDYLTELLPRCESGADVITFEQEADINGNKGWIVFDAACKIDEPWKQGAKARRRPWHVCAWRRDLAIQGVFTECNYGEDAAWVAQVAPLAKTHLHIPKVLHYYRHSAETTEAPPP